VSDDGIGFDTSGEFPGHLGLRSMRERAQRLGGTLTVVSSPGAGTAVHAHFPLRPAGTRA
ncbi:MAG TPA: ATP-binding protein, partial [Rubrobacteraceae bacterium]|nr:ATP-binding protein [Rubrobacteraceae bacterium]